MSIIINTNISSLNAQRSLYKTSQAMSNTFSRLASGLGIASSKDNAAGLSISTRISAQVRGLNEAQRNANNAISMAQVADGALEETTGALQRMRELAVQASNGTYTSADRATMQQEVDQLIAEVQNIATRTQFNNMTLLTGSYDSKTFQVGAFSGQAITVSIGSTSVGALGISTTTGGTRVDLSSQGGQSTAIFALDNALASISDIRATLGAIQNRLDSTIANLSNLSENLESSNARIRDSDLAEETARLSRFAILQQAGAAMLAQANQQPQLALRLLG